ncbi:MAG: acyl-CoA dehydrogenase family protein [Pseudomonadota bacterium]
MEPESQLATHEVTNQPGPPKAGLWKDDPVLRDWAEVAGAQDAALTAYAEVLGAEEMRAAGRDANRFGPELVPFDRAGRRIDEVRYHPGYHRQMAAGIEAGYAGLPWEGTGGGHATHAAMVYLLSQVDPGVCCPMTMTYAGIPALAAAPEFSEWAEKLNARAYDPRVAPLAEKAGATLGMAMTEKQGGSDVRMNTTRAEKTRDGWRLSGHKWFCSAPMSDGFLTLAQAPGGLSCFLVPRWLEGDRRNAVQVMRLKDKLGNRSNASAEIEYHGALALPLGAEGDGVRTILTMVHHTRLDTAMAPAGLMRAALAEAAHWARHRTVFQRRLVDQPLMAAVLADLVLDWEGATALGFRVARAFDDGAAEFARIAVALAKFHANKRCPVVVAEAMECLGGMGYVEDTGLPLFYREAPLNGIWEGSGNVICLDILRTLARVPAAREALEAELEGALGVHAGYARALDGFRSAWKSGPDEAQARRFAEGLAGLLTAAVLLRGPAPGIGAAYVASRLSGPRGFAPGAGPAVDTAACLSRLGI